MSEIIKKQMLECLYPGDPKVGMILGKQKPPLSDECIRRSCFVYSMYFNGVYVLFHTLTRRMMVIPPQAIDFFEGDHLFPSSVLEQELPSKLYKHHFLVPENTQESQIYLELKDILGLRENPLQGIAQYKILPTTACNARCFYCFEKDMKYHKMSMDTVEDTLGFILRHKPKNNKIHIHWFGGEPMCATEIIDLICRGLVKRGIEYTAEMTSNGSLFSKELAKKAADEWKIGKIQITLDGMADEYARRKCYSASLIRPFETVIQNIHYLIANDIRVSIRLNVDQNNIGEIYRLIDFLIDEFTREERKKLRAYAHSIYGQKRDGETGCPAGSGADDLEVKIMEINDYLQLHGLMFYNLASLYRFKSKYCMANSPECNVLIDSNGKLFACDAMTENMFYGNVRTDIDIEAWNRVSSPCKVRNECKKCVFLPQCTEFDRCPNRMPYDICYRVEKHKLEKELTFAYLDIRDQQKERQQDPDKKKE